jgi:hypothetical protein
MDITVRSAIDQDANVGGPNVSVPRQVEPADAGLATESSTDITHERHNDDWNIAFSYIVL